VSVTRLSSVGGAGIRRRLCGALVLGAATLALAGCGGSGGGTTDAAKGRAEGPPPAKVRVTLSVDDSSLRKVGDVCSGSGGYTYIHPGAGYTIDDTSGSQLASGSLPAGVATRRGAKAIQGAAVEPTSCDVRFTTSLPARPRYALQLDAGPTISFARSAIKPSGALALQASAASGDAQATATPGAPTTATTVASAGGAGGKSGLPGPLPAGAKLAPESTSAPVAHDFTVTLLDGTQVQASKLWATRPIVVDFMASWCARCIQQQPMLNALAAKYKNLIAFIGVASQDKPDALSDYLTKYKVPYAAGIDTTGTIWRDYAIDEPPTIAVIGKGGHFLHGWNVDLTQATLDAALSQLATPGS
jgi:thiol-disulfide isomerase/thioredoxin